MSKKYIKTCKNCGKEFEHPFKEFCCYDCIVEYRMVEAKEENNSEADND